jgi:hypothetical protein
MDPHCDANPKSPLLSTFNKGLKTKTWNPPKQKRKKKEKDLDAIQSSILQNLLEGHEARKEKKESNKTSSPEESANPNASKP